MLYEKECSLVVTDPKGGATRS
ncbi:hypothetical protein [Bacillus sp. TE8-1]|nr:hypothetical protein [Bacillus sp. TE8-1]